MTIVQQTPNLLIFRVRPVRLWLFGAFFALPGLFIFAIFAKVTTLTCSRTESANCQLVESGLLGAQSKQIPLNMLQGAKLEEHRDIDSDGSTTTTTYRVVILTSSDEVPFTFYSTNSGESEKEAIVSHIKNFINNPGITSLTEKQDDRFWSYLFGGIPFSVGLIALVTPVVTCVFDKTLDTMTIKQQGLLGTKVIEHQLREIKDVLIEESTDSDDSTCRVTIVLVGGDRLPLTSYYISNWNGSNHGDASCIKSFLNLNN